MSAIGPTELVVIAVLVLVMGLFWGVVAFFVGRSFFTRRRRPSASPASVAPPSARHVSWTPAEAVLLTAVAGNRRDLMGLIAEIDACDHGVMTEETFTASAQHLLGSGLIKVDGSSRFVLTERGRALTERRRGAQIEQVRSVGDLLSEVRRQTIDWKLPVGDYGRAVDAYVNRAGHRRRLAGPRTTNTSADGPLRDGDGPDDGAHDAR